MFSIQLFKEFAANEKSGKSEPLFDSNYVRRPVF